MEIYKVNNSFEVLKQDNHVPDYMELEVASEPDLLENLVGYESREVESLSAKHEGGDGGSEFFEHFPRIKTHSQTTVFICSSKHTYWTNHKCGVLINVFVEFDFINTYTMILKK